MEGEHRGLSRRERRYVEEMSRPAAEHWAGAGGMIVGLLIWNLLGDHGAGWAVRLPAMVVLVVVTGLGAAAVGRWAQRRGLG
ncbi:multisubunit Na+/H+ antiporter MnhG subunit [Nocardioides zeae]|uniref:Multisubunit Na+/H+ antiporter MnhG subunit n=1 Tax=Nocardioides zeae TaxID=1457234 RepID=A0ACC6IL29_9ACTN|nr:hypothetical protein [Nocardioides zeae]MDR6173985.1 multisubunit Na+/H+ antiporter MnhG subunit [Nocardioides zeae]MDR6211460.1 multisubunit Na+/H+ antiporter MnhG subunit [Nocardioides zeae]